MVAVDFDDRARDYPDRVTVGFPPAIQFIQACTDLLAPGLGETA